MERYKYNLEGLNRIVFYQNAKLNYTKSVNKFLKKKTVYIFALMKVIGTIWTVINMKDNII